jgi:hypothetical protein
VQAKATQTQATKSTLSRAVHCLFDLVWPHLLPLPRGDDRDQRELEPCLAVGAVEDRRGTRGERGCVLTPEGIAHYQRIVIALKETIRLMEEIDEVIETHGGWPIE